MYIQGLIRGFRMLALEFLENATGVFTSSSDSYELCRNVVHADFLDAGASGSQLVAIDQKGSLRVIASYGNSYPMPEGLSLWDDNPISKALGSKEVVSLGWEAASITVFPFYKSMAPVGGLVVVSARKVAKLENSAKNILAQLGAFYLDTNGLSIKQGAVRAEGSPEELTDRQRQVLGYMALGQTNAEIARVMLLSESTIRQETVRIYRAFGVNSRTEASKKGKALGLIAKQTAIN
jgi:DNA-binding CsgD family transcriptional regulator